MAVQHSFLVQGFFRAVDEGAPRSPRPSRIVLTCVSPLFPSTRESQESVKTKHPQLLYESKLYKILQGGSE